MPLASEDIYIIVYLLTQRLKSNTVTEIDAQKIRQMKHLAYQQYSQNPNHFTLIVY